MESFNAELAEKLASSGLSATFATLRPQLTRQLAAAGIALDWQENVAQEPEISARDQLQIGRIIQEAVINIIRHSRANNARIRIDADTQDLTLHISDDGVGGQMSEESKSGHGLKNMETRARTRGAALSFANASPGFAITLHFPIGQTSKRD